MPSQCRGATRRNLTLRLASLNVALPCGAAVKPIAGSFDGEPSAYQEFNDLPGGDVLACIGA
jgi:hypothetical protein